MKELGFETKAVRLQSQQTHQKEHGVFSDVLRLG